MLTMKFAASNLKLDVLCIQSSSTVFGINLVTSKCPQNKFVNSLSKHCRKILIMVQVPKTVLPLYAYVTVLYPGLA